VDGLELGMGGSDLEQLREIALGVEECLQSPEGCGGCVAPRKAKSCSTSTANSRS
jgi:hypothetical protein